MSNVQPILRLLAMTGLLLAGATPMPALAQVGPNGAIDPHRDCQTIRRCNFTRAGTFRGCISAYSCRSCQLVAARCSINGASGRVCREMRCNWGA
jgi:hypothetical protein